MSCLRQVEYPVARNAIVGRARGFFLEHSHHVIPAALGERGELRDLPLAGLVGRGNPGIDSGALSHLNPL